MPSWQSQCSHRPPQAPRLAPHVAPVGALVLPDLELPSCAPELTASWESSLLPELESADQLYSSLEHKRNDTTVKYIKTFCLFTLDLEKPNIKSNTFLKFWRFLQLLYQLFADTKKEILRNLQHNAVVAAPISCRFVRCFIELYNPWG